MAGFFNALLNSVDSDPDNDKNRDYRLLSEITTPEELDAYRAGESATGIPGLDYARSLFRGARKEITEPSMGPIGERFNEEMANYERRKAAAQRMQERYPEAYRAGRLRGTEAIPGAEAAFMAQPGISGAVSPFVRGAVRNAPGVMEREVAMQPRGFDLMGEAPAPAPSGSWEALDRLQRTDRTLQPRKSIWPELKLNPHGVEEAPVTPKMPGAADVSSQLTEPSSGSWSDVQPSDVNAKVRSLLLRVEQGGKPLTSFEQNMVNNYFSSFKNRPSLDMRPNAKLNLASPTMGIHGEVAADIDANIAARNAAEAARDERFARLPAVLQTNAFMKRANRLIEGAEEAQNFGLGKGRNSNFYRAPDPVVLGMEEAAAYKPPPSPNSVPLLAQNPKLLDKALNAARNVDPMWGAAGAAGAMSLTGANMLRNMRNNPEEAKRIADIAALNPNIPSSRMATPTMGEMYPVDRVSGERTIAKDVSPVKTRRAVEGRRTAEPHRAVARHAAPVRRPAASNEMYYGDYRDTEPFASDPIGRFIDELAGRKKTARARGDLDRRVSLGDLFPFEKGGVVSGRRHFEDGGTDGGIPGISDLGDALSGIGGLFGEGASSPRAQDSEEDTYAYGGMSPIKQALIAAGLGMMAASRPGTGVGEAIGAGGLKGFELYQAAQKLQGDLRQKELARRQHAQEMQLISGALGDGGAPVAADETATEEVKPAVAAGEQPAVTPADLKAPSGAPISPMKVAAEERPVSMPVARSDAALDSYIEKLREQHRKADRILPLVSDPAARAALANRQRSIEFEIRDLREQREKSAAEARAATTEKRLVEREEREAYEKSPEGLRKKVAAEEAAKNEPKLIRATRDAASVAENDIASIDEVLDAYKTGKIHTSPAVQAMAKFAQTHGLDFGFVDPESIKNTETLASLGVADLMKKIGGSLGTAVSEGDRKTIERMSLGTDKSPESNKKMLSALKKVMLRATESRDFMDKYIKEHGMLDENYERALEEHFASKPIFGETKTTEHSAEDRARAAEILRRRREGSK